MTAETTHDAGHGGPFATPTFGHARPFEGHQLGQAASDELTRMIMAVGSLMSWESAVSLEHRPHGLRRSVVVRSWSKAGSSSAVRLPEWVEQLDERSWKQRRTLWRPAIGRTLQAGSAVAVPVRVDGEIRGSFAFIGPGIEEPDEVTLGFLEAIAGLLSHRPSHDMESRPPTPEVHDQVSGLVDVFAYTVRVAGDGTLQWRYFGPNSRAIFGEGIYPDEPLSVLVAQHAHFGDKDKVRAFNQALIEGRRLETELRIEGLDGVTRWVSWRTDPRWADGALFVDGVATDVSARHAVERSNDEFARGRDEGRGLSLQEHALAVREANDAVLQRLFAAGLRLQMLKRKLGDVESHALSAIAFQLDQAANDLREVIQGLNAVANDPVSG